MKKPYKVRKMSFICEDGRVIAPNVHMTNAYQFREIAETVCKQKQPTGKYTWQEGKPIPKVTVEDFYLVHASLFNEVLEPFCIEVEPQKK